MRKDRMGQPRTTHFLFEARYDRDTSIIQFSAFRFESIENTDGHLAFHIELAIYTLKIDDFRVSCD